MLQTTRQTLEPKQKGADHMHIFPDPIPNPVPSLPMPLLQASQVARPRRGFKLYDGLEA